jgi:uncharacterized membrane protein
MTTAKSSVDVNCYVTAAYNQWTQFEKFPEFMDGVEEVRQVGDRHLRWRVKIGGVEREFDATITEQIPDTRIAWKADGETTHAGVVDFHKLSMDTTRVDLQLDLEPEGLAENVADKLGIVERRVAKDLERFKQLMESQSHPTGAWRGEIPREG